MTKKRITRKTLNAMYGPDYEVYATGACRGNVWGIRYHPTNRESRGITRTLATVEWVIKTCLPTDSTYWCDIQKEIKPVPVYDTHLFTQTPSGLDEAALLRRYRAAKAVAEALSENIKHLLRDWSDGHIEDFKEKDEHDRRGFNHANA